MAMQVKLKCYVGDEIAVVAVPADIAYRQLLGRLAETFGAGVVVHKYEDHLGDLITVHDGEQDLREAFALYAKAIRKQAKRESGVEPYLKLHLVKEQTPPFVDFEVRHSDERAGIRIEEITDA